MDAEYKRRRELTFRQAEWIDPLPSQMERGVLTHPLRAYLWSQVDSMLELSSFEGMIIRPMEDILRRVHVELFVSFAEFDITLYVWKDKLRNLFQSAPYESVLELVEFIIRDRLCPQSWREAFALALAKYRAAYRVVNGDTIMPVASDEEVAAVSKALVDTGQKEFQGANTHLRKSASALSKGDSAGSIRESIHAVESVARGFTGSDKLSDALNEFEHKWTMHRALKSAFLSLYGYASDEEGVRHALLEKGSANVGEDEALFMLTACSAFTSYLISKHRANAK